MEQKQQPKSKKKIVLWSIIFLALCGIGYAVYTLNGMQQERLAAQAQQDALLALAAQTYHAEATPAAGTENIPALQQTAEPELPPSRFAGWLAQYAKEPDRAVDFDTLHQMNGNIYAWVSVPGTSVDYPVVHTAKGDERYLDHDLEGNESKYGAVFTDGYNHPDCSDPMTVVYGHNMKDGSMFASLHYFEDAAFFEKNRIIRVYMADYMLEYEIVAAYETDDTHILAVHDFTDEAVYGAYLNSLDSLRDLTAKRWPRTLTVQDKLLTLATCVHGDDHARYLVQGVLKSNE